MWIQIILLFSAVESNKTLLLSLVNFAKKILEISTIKINERFNPMLELHFDVISSKWHSQSMFRETMPKLFWCFYPNIKLRHDSSNLIIYSRQNTIHHNRNNYKVALLRTESGNCKKWNNAIGEVFIMLTKIAKDNYLSYFHVHPINHA